MPKTKIVWENAYMRLSEARGYITKNFRLERNIIYLLTIEICYSHI